MEKIDTFFVTQNVKKKNHRQFTIVRDQQKFVAGSP